MKKLIAPFALLLLTSMAIAQVSSKEKQALLDFYVATQGENWVNTWDVNQPVKKWHGVTVTNNEVTGLQLLFNNLDGNIPASIEDLENLETLELSFNKLQGSIPSEIGNLSKLEILTLNGNDLSGTLPTEIGNITTLKQLRLSSNNFHGEIPNSFNKLTELELLNVFDNNLSGNLPIGLSYSNNLKKLVIAENEIVGTEAYSALLLFKNESAFKNNASLTPTAKTVIASERSDDEN